MPTFRCRSVKPSKSEWREVEALDPIDAAQEFHVYADDHEQRSYRYAVRTGDSGLYYVLFMRVEVEGVEEVFLSRLFEHGIYRKGGVKPPGSELTLEKLAQLVDWKYDPRELIQEEGWDRVETAEEAMERRDRKWESK